MPPKRTRNKSPVTPTRKAPSRNAKIRSAASTASMYKESDAYLASSSDELSYLISDPEDIASASDAQESGDNGDSDTFEEPARTRSVRAPKTPAKTAGDSNTKSGAKKASATEKGKGRTQKASGAPTSTLTPSTAPAKGSTRKVTPLPNIISPAAKIAKRKASNVRFAPLGSNPASSSSSSSTAATPTSASAMSSPSARVKATSKAAELNTHEDQWVEMYAPTDISEVAVHAGKISSVREWLQTYTDPRNRQQDMSGGAILVLSGPAGSGKTTVLKMLAHEMGLTVVEWINSVNENSIIHRPVMPGEDRWRSSSIDEEYIPVMNAFQEFFSRAQRFTPLLTSRDVSLQSSSSITGPSAGPLLSTSSTGKKNIILIEDLPPISAFSSRKIFQETITKFASSRNNSTSVLVIIVSDVFTKQSTELLFSNTSENRDPALTIRTLLPSSVLSRIDSGGKGCPRIKQIKFNPIAPTIMKKAIRRLLEREFRTTHTYAPDAAEIEQAIQVHDGDIRAVINALQFLCYVPAKKRKRYREAAEISEEEQQGLHESENRMTQGQDSSLGVFHAVAKVLYNRRNWSAPFVEFDRDMVKIPPQAWSKRRPPLRFSPEKDLIEKLPIEPDLYTLMLHQNYTRHMNTIDECQTAMEYLCIADQFSHSSGSSSASYTQMIQMQPYLTSLAVRGLLFAPESAGPTIVGGSGGGHKKHWWPEIFAINRVTRSNDQLFAEVAADLAGEEAQGLSAGHVTGPGFFPKRVVREELVPMLHRCVTMNPYMAIFNSSLRSSSKTFVRGNAGNYGKKAGIPKKEFGEGDEGFLEEIAPSVEGEAGGLDEIVEDSVRAPGNLGAGFGKDGRLKPQQERQRFAPFANVIARDEDPIEDFSD